MLTVGTMNLTQKHFLGKGKTKIVYRHPEDPNLCIKFALPKRRALNGLLREIKYLKRKQDSLPFLAPYRGRIECNLGTGYLYQLARNEDGSRSKGIKESLHTLDPVILHGKVVSIYNQLIEHRAVVNDLGAPNVFVIEHLSGDYDLCLVDGFGNNNFIKIADYSLTFLIKKLNRKFTKLCKATGIPADFLR